MHIPVPLHRFATSTMLVALSVLTPLAASAAAAPIAALGSTSRDATQALGRVPASSIVVAAPLESDALAPRGEALAVRLAALVAGRIGVGATARPRTADLPSARAVAGRASALVYVQGSIALGDLRLTVDLYPSTPNPWDRVRSPLPAPVGHAFARAKIDAEVRGYLAPLLLESLSVRRAKHDEGEVLAAGCGDLDGDGGNELAVVSRSAIALGRIRGGAFVRDRAISWTHVSPRASVPSREMLASAVVTEGSLGVGWTDRGGVTLDPALDRAEPLAGIPVWGGDGPICLNAQPAAGAFDGAPIACAMVRDPKPVMAIPAPRFDAFAAALSIDPAGRVTPVVAVREPSGRLRVRVGDASLAPEVVIGAQLAVLDLDQDGLPEVVSSVEGSEDAVEIFTVGLNANDIRLRLRLATPSPVRALAACPPEAEGVPSLVAVIGDEIWIVRAVAVAPAPGSTPSPTSMAAPSLSYVPLPRFASGSVAPVTPTVVRIAPPLYPPTAGP